MISPKLSPELLNMVNTATARNRERVTTLRALLANIDADPTRIDRLNQCTCALCWYEPGGMCGQAFSDWSCRVCGDKSSHPNTAVPRVCQACAKIYKLCHECGGDIGMGNRRIVRQKETP